MKTNWISAVYSLLIMMAAVFTVSCSSEEGESKDLFYISTDVKTKVSEGLKAVSKEDKDGFRNRLNALVDKCNSPEFANISDAQSYMETEEYQEFKEYIIAIAPDSYYLLIQRFLRGDVNIGPFSTMFQDIVEATYPGLITRVLDQLEAASMSEFLNTYPQMCVEYLLIEMENAE